MTLFTRNEPHKHVSCDLPVQTGMKAGYYEKPDGSICLDACAAKFPGPLHICENADGLFADMNNTAQVPCKGVWKVDFLLE